MAYEDVDNDIGTAVNALGRTPAVLDKLLRGLPNAWVRSTEGPSTWSPFDVVGHLIHGERTDWMVRLEIMLEHGPDRVFDPFDRFAQFEASAGRTLDELLDIFSDLRGANLQRLESHALSSSQLEIEGSHPELGRVTVRELIWTWVAHDYSHIGQVVRVLARRQSESVGPWREYLPIMKSH